MGQEAPPRWEDAGMDRELVPRAGSMRLDDGRLGRAGRRIIFLRLPPGGGGGGHENEQAGRSWHRGVATGERTPVETASEPLTRGLRGAEPERTNGQGEEPGEAAAAPSANSEEVAAGEAAAEAVAAAKAAEEAAAAADAAVQCRQLEVMAAAKTPKIANR